MFTQGAAAFAAVSNPRTYGYVCPLCLSGFEEEDLLTLEHVPPKSVGGKPICLTCRQCNSSAGHSVDAAVFRESVSSSFLASGAGPVRATLAAGDAVVNVVVERDESGTNMRIVGKASDPTNVAKLRTYLEASDETTLRLTHRGGYTRREAEIGYLKSAYLVTFAKFGYRYVARKIFNLARHQIAEPKEKLLPQCRVWVEELGAPLDTIVVFEEPKRCVGVKFGKSMVLLPWLTDTEWDHWDWLRELEERREPVPLRRGSSIEWPTACEMLMDCA